MEEELVDVFDENGVRTGETLQREEAIKLGKLIKAFQIWIVNNNNEVLMQIRSSSKIHDADMIDLCSGHVQSGETEIQAVIREIREELGDKAIQTREFENIAKIGNGRMDFRKYGRYGNYIIPWYCLKLKRTIPDSDFILQQEEVASVKWIPYELVKDTIKKGRNNIRIPYSSQTVQLLNKLDDYIYQKNQSKDDIEK